jgi:hypothetical protein
MCLCLLSWERSRQKLQIASSPASIQQIEKILYAPNGNVNLIILNQAHKLAKAFHDTWRSSFPRDDLSLILGKILVSGLEQDKQ